MMKMDPPDGMQQPPQPRTRLVQARVRLKLSQKQVAERIGTTFVNVSRWERGITKPSSYFRRRLVQLYGRTEEELDLAQSPTMQPSLSSTTISSPASTLATTSSISTIPATAPAVPISDPSIPLPPTTPLVGRDEELALLKQRLCSGSNV